ncbi:hypothetical protein [Acinetobacter sp. MD2(2019)]|uniref:hypothetical protein n=1 Tax=Acinetobacter sp. MD2(2019) TaxID=2605273 RepID=UPI002D1F56C8|nr:hypothetical protein [Acinetobacter sp. MD2(2019)]MEB3754770.1 hypothetical protein [Acinetobacter sp. MD2(2019)]
MKKLMLLMIPVLGMVGCGQSKQVSSAEAWQNFCKNIPGAAYNIMTDRQQNIQKTAALEHAKKVQEPHAQKYLIALIEEAYQVPIYQQLGQQQQAMEDFSKNRYESCLKQAEQK